MHKTTAKIFNDPVHGFIEVPDNQILRLIDNPVFQRLRNIKQLGLTSFVYPGALHSRFSHSLGAYHLTRQALRTLKIKGVPVSYEEEIATLSAILLHDIGHAPFSHVLEFALFKNITHEKISLLLMQRLNSQMNHSLELAIDIYQNKYHRPLFHRLISGQLDMDRIDYLIRDSFFTGVAEGIIGTDRLIKTLNINSDEEIVVEEKGIYSVEKFLIARRLMYWQVYLHKTSLAVESMLQNLLKRAVFLLRNKYPLFLPEDLKNIFLNAETQTLDDTLLASYLALDDHDILFTIKQWTKSQDKILADLSRRLLHRKLFKLKFLEKPLTPEQVQEIKHLLKKQFGFSEEELRYYFFQGKVSNAAYMGNHNPILIMKKSGECIDIKQASDLQNIASLTQIVEKYYFTAPAYLQLSI